MRCPALAFLTPFVGLALVVLALALVDSEESPGAVPAPHPVQSVGSDRLPISSRSLVGPIMPHLHLGFHLGVIIP